MNARARKVVIAEDEPSIMTSLEFLMRKCAYDVRVARSGDEALRVVEDFVPDVLLLDVMMPGHDGFEICRRIRGNPALGPVRIIMLTARGLESEKARGLALGADAYLTKPFSTKELLAQVGRLMPAA